MHHISGLAVYVHPLDDAITNILIVLLLGHLIRCGQLSLLEDAILISIDNMSLFGAQCKTCMVNTDCIINDTLKCCQKSIQYSKSLSRKGIPSNTLLHGAGSTSLSSYGRRRCGTSLMQKNTVSASNIKNAGTLLCKSFCFGPVTMKLPC